MAKIFCVANQKGGVAKTTSSLSLAAALHEKGQRVLVVDLDPQSNLSMSQGIDVDNLRDGMYDVLVKALPIKDIVQVREIDIAPAGIELASAELSLSSMIGRERALQRALEPARTQYDYIILDTPPSLGLLTINAMVAAQGVIVPVQCEYLSLRGLAQLTQTLEQVQEHLNPDVHIFGILPTMYDGRTMHCREAVDVLIENFGDVVFRTRIGKTVRFAERVRSRTCSGAPPPVTAGLRACSPRAPPRRARRSPCAPRAMRSFAWSVWAVAAATRSTA